MSKSVQVFDGDGKRPVDPNYKDKYTKKIRLSHNGHVHIMMIQPKDYQKLRMKKDLSWIEGMIGSSLYQAVNPKVTANIKGPVFDVEAESILR